MVAFRSTAHAHVCALSVPFKLQTLAIRGGEASRNRHAIRKALEYGEHLLLDMITRPRIRARRQESCWQLRRGVARRGCDGSAYARVT